MTYEEAINQLRKMKPIGAVCAEAIDVAIEALENCPSENSLCYGCHDNCRKCESMLMLSI